MSMAAEATGRLAKDGDVVFVSSEGADMVLYPLQSQLLIHNAVVARRSLFRRQCGVRQVTQGTQPIVNCDYYHAFFYQGSGVIKAASPVSEGTAMEPNHYR